MNESITTVNYVDIQKFMGDWYVQAGRFTALEKEVHNAIETYEWNEKKERIDISFTYRKGGFDGKEKSIPQKAWIHNQQSHAHWKVSPIWPLKFDYLVVALDKDYQWCAIGVPSQKYLWIMTRSPDMNEDHPVWETILNSLTQQNYDISNLVYVPHRY